MELLSVHELQHKSACEDTMLTVRLPEHVEKRIAELACRTGRTKAYCVREAIVEQLDSLEDKDLALDRLENPAKR